MLESNDAMDIVALSNGRFGVRDGDANLLGEFASRAEAEAWILQRSMIDDENAFDTGVLKPGQGQDVS